MSRYQDLYDRVIAGLSNDGAEYVDNIDDSVLRYIEDLKHPNKQLYKIGLPHGDFMLQSGTGPSAQMYSSAMQNAPVRRTTKIDGAYPYYAHGNVMVTPSTTQTPLHNSFETHSIWRPENNIANAIYNLAGNVDISGLDHFVEDAILNHYRGGQNMFDGIADVFNLKHVESPFTGSLSSSMRSYPNSVLVEYSGMNPDYPPAVNAVIGGKIIANHPYDSFRTLTQYNIPSQEGIYGPATKGGTYDGEPYISNILTLPRGLSRNAWINSLE